MDFLTPGQRLKKIRKELQMTQNDFIDDTMTRSYFGMIEVGKRNLNLSSAKLILGKLKARAKELNVEFNIDEAYLLMSKEEEARIYCINKMKNNPTEEDVLYIIDIASKYSLKDVEAEADKLLGDISYKQYKFLDAFIKYNNSLEICKEIGKIDIQCYLNNRLGMCKYNELDYIESLLYFNRAQQCSVTYKNEGVEINSIFNMALAYKKINKIDEAMKHIDLYLTKIDKRDDYVKKYSQANILKVNCLRELGRVDDAIVVLNDLLAKFEGLEKSIEANIYNNLGIFYLEKDDFDNSLKAFDISESIRLEHDKSRLSHTIIEKSNLYIQKELYTEAIILIKMGCDLAEAYNDYYYLLEAYYLLVDIYEKSHKYKDAEEIYFKIIKLVKEKYNESELLKVYLKLTELYINQKDVEKAAIYIKLSQNISGKC